MEFHDRVSDIEFNKMKDAYEEFNRGCSKHIVFHVGTGAGMFSELGAMLECMMFCYKNNIGFTLYSDDANFSNENGWVEFFEPFCRLSHNKLNHVANYRYKKYFRIGKIAVPSLVIRRFVLPTILKAQEKVDYLTQDLFFLFISEHFRNSHMQWSLFNIDGIVKLEYGKLSSLALRYNEETKNRIEQMIINAKLPEQYISIQIRGGDKKQEFTDIIDAEFCIKEIEKHVLKVSNLFVFTDDYRNVEYIRKERPNWKVYTLTRDEERGYYNDSFNILPWAIRCKELIKLLAIVEICINSEFHIGCDGACVNYYIRSCRHDINYSEYKIGKKRTKKGIDKILRILGV